MAKGARAGGHLRYRITYDAKANAWYCVRMDRHGNEIARAPNGTHIDAERYENNCRRYGAWEKS